MKAIIHLGLVIFFLSIAALSKAQQTASGASPTSYSVVQRNANSRIWESTSYETLPSGKVVPHVHHYTELATGLCYQQNGQWVDSQEQINILPDGSAAATSGQHQAYFPVDIYNGLITLVTSDGLRLKSRPLGLSYDDGTNMVLVAELTNSVGQLISSNQVIYANAFVGIDADLLYTYRKGGFEQDVIFREQPPAPEEFGMDSSNSTLQMVTEFFDSPTPIEGVKPVNPQDGLQDTTLTFGQMEMMQGKAFLIGNNSQNLVNHIPIYKEWSVVDGRRLLVEGVSYKRISSQLSTLPMTSASQISAAHWPLHKISSKRLLPQTKFVKTAAKAMHFAKTALHQTQGLVLDYVAMDSNTNNFTFQGDTTYYISGDDLLSGTTILEGGSVLKFDASGSIVIDGPLTCETASYRPAVFTSYNDNTIGEEISGSSGSPNYRDVQADLVTIPDVSLHDARFCYAVYAAWSLYGGSLSFRDCQFWNIETLVLEANNAYLYNDLIGYSTDESSAIYADGNSEIYVYGNLVAENVTSDSGYGFIGLSFTSETIALTNCLITSQALTNDPYGSGCTFLTNDVAWVPSPSEYIYQTVGGGNYYLADGTYRGVGTTNIDPCLLAELAQKTTWPPTVYDGTDISYLGTLCPTVPRDINGLSCGCVDLGYHYDPLDYAFGGCDLESDLTFAAGTAVGWFQDWDPDSAWYPQQPYSIALLDGANLSFEGTATQQCYFANYAMVQEGGNGNWTDSGYYGGILLNGSGNPPLPQLSANFTKWTLDSDCYNFFRDYGWDSIPADGICDFQNSEFYNGSYSTFLIQYVGFANCLLFRDSIAIWSTPGYNSTIFTNEDCTYYNGGLFMSRTLSDSAQWTIENTAFDGTAFDWNDSLGGIGGYTNVTIFNYNSYNTNNPSWQTYSNFFPDSASGTLETVGSNDVRVTNYNWQSSWFGNFYLPTNSPLITNGSTPANLLGLYWFTTQTNQLPETNAIVDIGYHYVAADTNGNPLVPTTAVIMIQPVDQYQVVGGTVTFTVVGEGVTGVSYQWQFNGTDISGATGATLTVTNVQSTNASSYTVTLTDTGGAGSVTSSNVSVNLVTVPVITSETLPTNQLVFYTNNETLSVSVAAPWQDEGFPLSYQWQFDGTNISRATSTNYTFTATNSGTYSITASNAAGSVTDAWQVTVIYPSGVIGWGANSNGQTNALPGLTNVISLAAGEAQGIVALDSGSVSNWGSYWTGSSYIPATTPPLLTNALAVAAGSRHDLVLKTDGTVVSWGVNDFGQTNVPSNATNVAAVAAGGQQSLALLQNGTVLQWGQPNAPIPAGLTNVSAIAAGTNFCLALLSNSTVVAWGMDNYGQTNVPAGLSNVVAIAAGGFHALALQQDGIVVAWGDNAYGETNVPAGLSNVMNIAAGDNHSIALENNGTVFAWGDNTFGESDGGLSNIKLIAGGGGFTLAVQFSPFTSYPINVPQDLLLIYNTNSADSTIIENYYMQNRPMIGAANVLGIGYSGIFVTNGGLGGAFIFITNTTVYETITSINYTNEIFDPVQRWLNGNPTKRPQYVILFLDVPSRVDDTAINVTNYPFYDFYGGTELPSVSCKLATAILALPRFGGQCVTA